MMYGGCSIEYPRDLCKCMMYEGDVIESKDRTGDIIMGRIWYGRICRI